MKEKMDAITWKLIKGQFTDKSYFKAVVMEKRLSSIGRRYKVLRLPSDLFQG